MPPESWNGDRSYLHWFGKLASSPAMIFFLHNEDARFYTLAEDIRAENQLEVKEGDMKGKQMVALEGQHLNELMRRLYNLLSSKRF